MIIDVTDNEPPRRSLAFRRGAAIAIDAACASVRNYQQARKRQVCLLADAEGAAAAMRWT